MIYFKAIFLAFFSIFLVASEVAAASYKTYSVSGYNISSAQVQGVQLRLYVQAGFMTVVGA